MLSQKEIKKFMDLYKIETGRDISYQEASMFAKNLVDMVRVVYRPIKKSALEKS